MLKAEHVPTALGFGLLVTPGDYSSDVVLRDGIYEVPETDLVTRLVRPGDLCIDAGCHIGYYTCLTSQLAGQKGRVIGFDANPELCRRTCDNLSLNNLRGEVIHAALGDQDGTVSFNISTDDQTGLSSLGPIAAIKETISVPLLRLEDFLSRRDIEHVRLLKLDVEGAEEIALRGLGRFLAEHRVDFVLVECNDERLQLLNTSTEKVSRLLRDAGYAAWEYGTAASSGWTRTDRVQSRDDCNYLFSSPSVSEHVPRVSLAAVISHLQRQKEEVQKSIHSRPSAPVPTLTIPDHAGSTALKTPGQALWDQREVMAAMRNRLKALSEAVDRPGDLFITQWVQITAFALDFRPDVIIELGRGFGNSTCCFLEVANQLGGPGACRVLSLCLSDSWFDHTLPRVRKLVPEEWFAPADVRKANLLDFDFQAVLEKCERPFIFWDAHGFEIAECVLGSIVPSLVGKEHRVLMHDLSDIRYSQPQREYGDVGLWKGENATDPSFWLGHIFSRVAQAISVLDFTNRNSLPLHSADESLHQIFASDAGKLAELRRLLGEQSISLQGHWFWFSLNEGSGSFTFPRFIRPDQVGTEDTSSVAIGDLQQQMASLRQDLGNRPQKDEQAEAQIGRLQNDIDFLLDSLKNHEHQLARLHESERRWKEVEQSAGWRMLNSWRRVRNRCAPKGSFRRKIYDAVLKNMRGET